MTILSWSLPGPMGRSVTGQYPPILPPGGRMGRWVESCRARREACQFASPVFGQHNASEVEQVRMPMQLGLDW